MLKRYQVLINDWLADYLKDVAKLYGISYSEALRLASCLYAGEMANELYPEYKYPFTKKKLKDIMRAYKEEKLSKKDLAKVMSQIYFESRKALEFMTEKRKADKKANS